MVDCAWQVCAAQAVLETLVEHTTLQPQPTMPREPSSPADETSPAIESGPGGGSGPALPPTSSPLTTAVAALYSSTTPSFFQRLRHWGRYRIRTQTGAQLARGSLPLPIPNCTACTDTCCKSPSLVSLRLIDIARLVDAGHQQAVARVDRPARRAIHTLHPALEAAESKDSFRYFPVLRQKVDGTCVFLTAQQRCGVYAIRPLACRAFPYLLNDDLKSVRFAEGACSTPAPESHSTTLRSLTAAVAAQFDAKVRDLMAVHHLPAALARLGLVRFLRAPFLRRKKNENSNFATHLRNGRKKGR